MYSNIQRNGFTLIGLGWGMLYHFLAAISIFFAVLALGTIIRCIWNSRHVDQIWQ
ncbi:hypothetical protein [Pediococcus stilesii]|uniref:hypothetical protein n=1 Tax=Pediococcus stilesii TaxID=331679 RepID=UPI0014872406|nr:hypothetical protein [Pediococcus stilesii]